MILHLIGCSADFKVQWFQMVNAQLAMSFTEFSDKLWKNDQHRHGGKGVSGTTPKNTNGGNELHLLNVVFHNTTFFCTTVAQQPRVEERRQMSNIALFLHIIGLFRTNTSAFESRLWIWVYKFIVLMVWISTDCSMTSTTSTAERLKTAHYLNSMRTLATKQQSHVEMMYRIFQLTVTTSE